MGSSPFFKSVSESDNEINPQPILPKVIDFPRSKFSIKTAGQGNTYPKPALQSLERRRRGVRLKLDAHSDHCFIERGH